MNKQFKKIIARFKPYKINDLRKELIPMIGETAEFYYYWEMDNNDPFPNEWALATKDERFCGYWIPERDLEIIE